MGKDSRRTTAVVFVARATTFSLTVYIMNGILHSTDSYHHHFDHNGITLCPRGAYRGDLSPFV
jgi:hypothetical protein